VASRIRFLRPAAPVVPEVDIQKLVYDLVLERATAMFGPGSSFAVTLRRTGDAEDIFTETVVETLAWDVSLHAESKTATAPVRLSA
jgi:hypothetical protein